MQTEILNIQTFESDKHIILLHKVVKDFQE